MAQQAECVNGQPPTLPENLEAERYILGACLSSKDAVYTATSRLAVADFAPDRHRVIFTRIVELAQLGLIVDRVTLHNILSANGELGKVGGLDYLVDLDEKTPDIKNVGAWIEIVRDKSDLRTLILIQTRYLLEAEQGARSAHAIAKDLSSRLYADLKIKKFQRPESLAEIADSQPINERLNPTLSRQRQQYGGVYSGFAKTDELTDGLHRGENWIIGGAPGSGKTSILLQISKHNAERDIPNLIFSLEMTKESLYQRLIVQLAEVPFVRFLADELNAKERMRLTEADAYIHSLPIWIDDSRGLTMADIGLRTRRAKEEHGIQLASLDFLQKVEPDKHSRDNTNQQLSRICNQFVDLASEEVPFVLLSQLNRTNRRLQLPPTMEDLRDSGAIEQAAQVIIFPWLEEFGAKSEAEKANLQGKAHFIIAKNRNGAKAKIPMTWYDWRFMYTERHMAPVPVF